MDQGLCWSEQAHLGLPVHLLRHSRGTGCLVAVQSLRKLRSRPTQLGCLAGLACACCLQTLGSALEKRSSTRRTNGADVESMIATVKPKPRWVGCTALPRVMGRGTHKSIVTSKASSASGCTQLSSSETQTKSGGLISAVEVRSVSLILLLPGC